MPDKSPLKSKKFIAMVVGIIVSLFVYITGGLVMAFVPEVAAGAVNLATVTIGSVASFISLYAVGQSAVDWKINSVTKANMVSVTDKNLNKEK
jgi:hypothetical protein